MKVEDWAGIRDLGYAYAYYIDRGMVEEFVGCFTEDATFDESAFGEGVTTGHKEIRDYAKHLVDSLAHVRHHMTNLFVTEDGESTVRATVEAIVESQFKEGSRNAMHARFHVSYDDIYSKVDGKWKIRSRLLYGSLEPEILSVSGSAPAADTLDAAPIGGAV